MRSICCVLALLVVLSAPARAESIEPYETLRIQAHLASALDHLGARDVADLPFEARKRRAIALASLASYIERGVFPLRMDDADPGLRPRFIDASGVHCAVAHLIAESGAPELARAINAAHEYDDVRDMQMPELVAWATANGFTVDELALIQPRYSSPATLEQTRDQIERSIEPIVRAIVNVYGWIVQR